MSPSLPQPAPADDVIDLGQLAASLRRRWQLIAQVAGGTLLLSAVITLLQKPVWEGEFQIVLADPEKKQGGGAAQLLAQNPALASLIGTGGGGKDSLETEVKILESPSVLKPVFDFVKTSKQRAGENVDRLRYADWLKDDLEIKLEKGTSVLNLAYRDTNKPLVLPVIDRISKAYQDYSGRDRERGLVRGVAYLDQQIEVYRLRAVASLRAAQRFAIEQDLTALKGGGKGDEEVVNSLNIEAIRVQAANEIRNINEQLKQLRSLGSDPNTVMFQGLLIPELAAQGLPQRLNAIDNQLAFLRSKFTEREDSIRTLKQERTLLIGLLKTKAFGFLDAKRSAAQARLAAADRPKGVLIRYRELLRVAARDEATLNKLEDERRVLALEQARKPDPWQLISTPTLLDKPVSPSKGRNLALGLLAGLVLGSGAALVAELRSGRVFATDELQAALPGPLLARLDPAAPESWAATMALLASGPLTGSSTVAMIPVDGQGEPELAEALQGALQQATPGAQVLCTSDLVEAGTCQAQLLVARPGAITRPQLDALRQQLQLQGRPSLGWLLLQSTDA
ncbi:MAG: Wzz/FepE/Etk N-terminal domain-containing protein [Cyanobium sp. LacPavin_0920_WC12_MAG_63_22]|nr:Wzz/FepE/Etk N-terminal domain-containing protein [Cyanobium sp. LacPavin_0920_WC12_MAG_63_22]